MDPLKYRNVMRHQAGAVAIIAVGKTGHRTGLTATAVCSLSDTPPMLIVCINRTASAHAPIRDAKSFSVNLLADDQQDLAKLFSSKKVMGEARFDKKVWDTMKTGAPMLKGCIANLDCEVKDEHGFDTHSLFVGLVKDARFREDAQPLLYFRGDFWDLRSK